MKSLVIEVPHTDSDSVIAELGDGAAVIETDKFSGGEALVQIVVAVAPAALTALAELISRRRNTGKSITIYKNGVEIRGVDKKDVPELIRALGEDE
jgi:hypothetical protein